MSNSRKFIFVHIHKTAGSSITTALAPTLRWNDLLCGVTEYGKSMENALRKAYRINKHSDATEIKRFVGEEVWKEYFTFAFVRNPYYRLISLYTWLARVAKQHGVERYLRHFRATKKPWCWPGMKAYLDSKDFSEFIRHEELLHSAPGAKPMLDCVSERGSIIVRYVGRVESMDRDFAHVCEMIGEQGLRAPVRNVSKRTPGLDAYYRSQADLDLVYERYRADFEAFGYGKE